MQWFKLNVLLRFMINSVRDVNVFGLFIVLVNACACVCLCLCVKCSGLLTLDSHSLYFKWMNLNYAADHIGADDNDDDSEDDDDNKKHSKMRQNS